MKLSTFVRDYFPDIVHEWSIGYYNARQYKKRHSGSYLSQRYYYAQWDNVKDFAAIQDEQQRRLTRFMNYVARSSKYYSQYVSHKQTWRVEDLSSLPIVTKKDLVTHAAEISTINSAEAQVSYTGGTTGASLRVLYTQADIQERSAVLDNFRSKYGYELGEKTAWFSGKEILSKRNIASRKFFKDDRFDNIRFFSTFHFNQETAPDYWLALSEYKPKFIVGFPFSVYEICRYAELQDLSIDLSGSVFFPTAETVTDEHRRCIGKVLKCRIVDQYASSEGAPFILECTRGRLHIHPLTGIFEVVDDDLRPAISGQILVTAFATTGTPLVRYQIGDSIALSTDSGCDCGSVFPLVDRIDGRASDYLVSPETGRISGVNLGNATKYIKGLQCFQAVQDQEDKIILKVASDHRFDAREEKLFVQMLRERVGNKMKIEILRVDSISKGKSGKFRIIINNLPVQE